MKPNQPSKFPITGNAKKDPLDISINRSDNRMIKKEPYLWNQPKNDPFGKPPVGYIPGKGRGATGFSGGVSRDDTTDDKDKNDYSDFNYDEFHGYSEALFKDTEYDEEDKEADEIYEQIDEKMDIRRKSRRESKLKEQISKMRAEKPTIQEQFSDLKKNLANVTLEEWESIPNVVQFTPRPKRKNQQNSYLPAPDSLLISRIQESNKHLNLNPSTSTGAQTPIGLGLKTPLGLGLQTPLGLGLQTPLGLGLQTPMYRSNQRVNPLYNGMSTPFTLAGYSTPLNAPTNASGLNTPFGNSSNRLSLNDVGEARGTVLCVQLDELMDSVGGQTVIDPKGYLTSLNSTTSLMSGSDLADLNKARSLLKSVISTNPKHGPAWIASARIEELAQRKDKAREILRKGCVECATNEDVWLEAVRLEEKNNEAKRILANAIKHIPTSVKLWVEAYKREKNVDDQRKVLRKAIEYIPNSVRLWKEAISLENETNAYILLKRAVECIPSCVEMWIALARLCSYSEAQKVLNEARKKIPSSAEIWVNAAKLEEQHGNVKMVNTIISRCIENLSSKNIIFERDKWIQFAEECEKSNFLRTCESIIKNTMNIGIEHLNKKRTYKQDAQQCIMNKSFHTARTLYNEALRIYKNKKSLWIALANLELAHGNIESVEEVLERAVNNCPHSSDLWLMFAKQKWLNNQVNEARHILAEAFIHNQNTEVISLAAIKLERENNEFERARYLLKKSCTQCNTPNIWMQAVQLERLLRNYKDAKDLVKQALQIHRSFDKLYMIAGQIEMEAYKLEVENDDTASQETKNRKKEEAYLNAQQIFEKGLKYCPSSIYLWVCAIDLQIEKKNYTSARALVEKAKIKIKYLHSIENNAHVLKNKEIIETNDTALEEEGNPISEDMKNENTNEPILNKKSNIDQTGHRNTAIKVIENYDLLWLKLIEIELCCNQNNVAPFISLALKECPSSGILWAKAIELENKNMQNSKSVTAFNSCGNNAYVVLTVAKLFWNNLKIIKARKWFHRVISLNPKFGDGWATFLAFEIDQKNEINQKDIINKCIKAEPNRGYMWNRIVKKVENWRLTYPQKMYKFVKEVFPEVLKNPISGSVWQVITDENVKDIFLQIPNMKKDVVKKEAEQEEKNADTAKEIKEQNNQSQEEAKEEEEEEVKEEQNNTEGTEQKNTNQYNRKRKENSTAFDNVMHNNTDKKMKTKK